MDVPAPLDTAEVENPRYGTGMLRRYGWFYKVLGLGRALSSVRFEENSVARLKAAEARGTLVYVFHSASAFDHLALNAVLNRNELPLSVWSNGTSSFWWQPVAEAWRDLYARWTRERADPVSSGWLTKTVAQGEVVSVFLQGVQGWWSRLRGVPQPDAMGALLAAQELSERPIQLVPVVVLWTNAPSSTRPTQNWLLGRGTPRGVLAGLRNAWFRSESALVQAGEPIDLAEYTDRARPEEAQVLLRRVLRRYLKRESQVVQGPRLLSYNQMKKVVLDNPAMRRLAQDEARATGTTEAAIRGQMDKEYRKIAANFRWWVVRVSDVLLRPLWTRVFSGVDVRPEDLERIRAAMRGGSCVVVPSHKSHFDYILVTWMFYKHNLIIPHVVAGANLAIFPVSVFLRSVGGFFIKRSFAGERIHPEVFGRYLRELIFQGYPVEFFIEGGRTRSGKLLSPKVGVLSMVFDAAERRPTDHEVTLLPVSIAYEQVAEEGAYVREASGEEKKAETVGQLVKARSVLRRRFGRVYLRVGEPIACSELVDGSEDTPPWSVRDASDRKRLLHHVGERILHRIGEVTVVLPTCLCAAAMLAHHRRGVTAEDLRARIDRFRAFLRARGAMEAASMAHYDQALRTALDRFERAGHIEALEHDGQRIWSVDPSARISLEFYKNQLLNFFAPAGFVAMVLRGLPDAPQPRHALREGLALLVWVWRKEFRFDPDVCLDALLGEGLEALALHGAVVEEDGLWRVLDPERVGEIHSLFRNFGEAYLLVLRRQDELANHTRKTFAKHLSEQSDKLLAAGVVSRPESLSVITLNNAVKSFLESGVFTEADGALGSNSESASGLAAKLAPMVE